jgi:hypothetical protein
MKSKQNPTRAAEDRADRVADQRDALYRILGIAESAKLDDEGYERIEAVIVDALRRLNESQ